MSNLPIHRLAWTLLSKDEIQIWRSGANLKIVLNRPRNGNALTTDMVAQITRCVRESATDKSISRIILAAEGKFFCTGMDLGKSTGVGKGGGSESQEFDKFTGLFRAIEESPKVTIACINGPSYAGGVGLAFSCDIRLAVANATVTLSEVKLGLCPAIISKYLAREWGPAFTREAILSGRVVQMQELKGIGAVHELAPDAASLNELLDTYLGKLRVCAPTASSMCKKVIDASYRFAGQELQDKIIKQVFEEMMLPGSESTIGVRNFQLGKKHVDWDDADNGQIQSKL